MKHYVFAGDTYYPQGGINDLKFVGTLNECQEFVRIAHFDWYQIVKFTSQGEVTVESKYW